MTGWSGLGEAYAASYESLCAGTNTALVRMLGTGDGRPSFDEPAGQHMQGGGVALEHTAALAVGATVGPADNSTSGRVGLRSYGYS